MCENICSDYNDFQFHATLNLTCIYTDVTHQPYTKWLRTIESEGVFTSEVYTILDVLSHITSQDDYLIIRREVRYGTDFYNFAFVFLHDRNCLCVYLACNDCDIISLQCCKKCKVFWTTCWQTSLVQN